MAIRGITERALLRLGLAAAAMLAALPARAAEAPPSAIYSCVDGTGKKLTSDRPIIECNTREQRVLNADGSVKRIMPPTPTADERAEAEARERAVLVERSGQQEAMRRDRNLLARFPIEAAHRKAREAALDDVRKALGLSESRIALLTAERKPLMDEAEFYPDRKLPVKLKAQIDANDASLEAQRTLKQNQQLEVVRINKLYDAELERLKKLWLGAQPGSMGALPGQTASAPRSAVRAAASASAVR